MIPIPNSYLPLDSPHWEDMEVTYDNCWHTNGTWTYEEFRDDTRPYLLLNEEAENECKYDDGCVNPDHSFVRRYATNS